MKIVRHDESPDEQVDAPLFTAPVRRRTVLDGTVGQFNVGYVTFPDGVRNKFHTHSTDQVLIVTRGRCVVVTEHERVELDEGDVVLAPAGEKHWHGAVEGTAMTHITITGAGARTEQKED